MAAKSSLGRAWAALLATLAVSPTLHASGFFQGNRGVQATARGGAFVAKADDLSALLYNPAGLAFINGTEVQIADRIAYSAYQYTRAPTQSSANAADAAPTLFPRQENGDWRALDPAIFFGSNFGLPGFGLAAGAYALPGRGPTRFAADAGSRYVVLENNTVLLGFVLGAGYRFTQYFSVGLTLQALRLQKQSYSLIVNANPFAKTASNVADQLDMRVTLDAQDTFTPNLTLGVWASPFASLELGAAVQVLPVEFNARGKLQVKPVSLGTEELPLYREGTAQNPVLANDVELHVPLPLSARLGARHVERAGEHELWDLEFDVHYETWSRVQRMEFKTHGLKAAFLGTEFNLPDLSFEKHWRDTLTFALGGSVQVLPKRLQLLAGGYFETALADPAYSAADTTTGAHVGAGFGARVELGPVVLGLGLELRHMFPVNVAEAGGKLTPKMPNSPCVAPYTDTALCAASTLGQPGPVVNAGSYRSNLWGATLGASYRF